MRHTGEFDQLSEQVLGGVASGAGAVSQQHDFAYQVRRIVLEQSKRANVGHIGSALSIADIIAALYGSVLTGEPDSPSRDRFVLSKGHAALSLYAALYLRGLLSQKELDTFCTDGSLLGVHPESTLRGIDFTTGSLGQGLAMGTGAALAARLQDSPARVFVLVSDAECNEGSLWESAMFAAHHQLANLIVILDLNGQQALGYTKNVLDLAPQASRWKAIGWDVQQVNGHDVSAISDSITKLETSAGPPHIIIADTVFGKGVSFMESQIKWHYQPMSDDEYQQALAELSSPA